MSECKLCGEPMPDGEEMFNYNGYSCDCPKPPLKADPYTKEYFEQVDIASIKARLADAEKAYKNGNKMEPDYMEEVCSEANKVIVLLESKIAHPTNDAKTAICYWSLDEEGYNYYSTGCGEGFTFNDGHPEDNSFAYCPYCGCLLEVCKESDK